MGRLGGGEVAPPGWVHEPALRPPLVRADIGENPTSAGGAPGGAGPYVTGLARLEAAGLGNQALP